VFRRVQTPPHDLEQTQPTSSTRQSVIGSGPLDALFGGGVFDGSVTMVVGISGAGKTVLGTQLLLEGARHQKRGLMVSLDEHPAQVIRNAETLGLNLREHLDSGTIQFFYDCPREIELDVHFARIVRTIEAHNIERLIVDGMTSYTSALEEQQQYREFFHALVSYSKNRLMTTFLSYENPELFGVNHFMPDFPVSSIVDNIVLLNFVELGNTLHRAITVAKARGSANRFVTREFTIGPGGITLMPEDAAAALPVLPFQSYYGLLSRTPTRLSPVLSRGLLPPDSLEGA
jgi:circadian clock protein KaiC